MPAESKGKRAEPKPSPYQSHGGPSREMELKRSRGEVSCAECRRLKIKCDRTIPCSRCTARGCASICPQGSLATGQGTRFVLAATEHLHKKISKMTDRIRLLEDALTALQAKHHSDPHPLLTSNLATNDPAGDASGDADVVEQDVRTKTAVHEGTSSELMEAFGTLSISDHGVSRFFGPTGGPESLLMTDDLREQLSPVDADHHHNRFLSHPSTLRIPSPHNRTSSADFGPKSGFGSLASPQSSSSPPSDRHSTPPSYAYFSSSFPFTPVGNTAQIKTLIIEHLPPYDRAVKLCDVYLERAAWLFRSVGYTQVIDEMLPFFYSGSYPESGMHEPESTFSSVDSKGDEDQPEYNGPHDLALLFIVFAIGTIMDFTEVPMASTTYKSSPDATREDLAAEAEHYHQIAQAAICLQPILEKPSLSTIQALHLLSIYNAMRTTDSAGASMEMTWSLVTLSAHLSQTVGLHRDSSRWGLSPKMINRRRLLFWDIFVAQSWQSLSTGRPPSFALEYIDCELPDLVNVGSAEAGVLAPEHWGFLFAKTCVAEVVARTLTAESPSYATILELDRKVREFPMPPAPPADAPTTPVEAIQRCVMLHIKEVVLMYIHRSFFAQALVDQPLNPLKSAYAPSFLAAYRAATTILRTVKDQFVITPELCSRFWSMMTYAFASAVVFGTVVTRGSGSPLAKSALSELEQACHLFSKAAAHSHRALVALPILLKLRDKGRACLDAPDSSAALNDGSLIKMEEVDDELCIYAGKTRYVSTRRAAPAIPLPTTAPSSAALPTSTVDPSLQVPRIYTTSSSTDRVNSRGPSSGGGYASSDDGSRAGSSQWSSQPQQQRYTHEEYVNPRVDYHDYGPGPSSGQTQQEMWAQAQYHQARLNALQHQQQQRSSSRHQEEYQEDEYVAVPGKQAYYYGDKGTYTAGLQQHYPQEFETQPVYYTSQPDPRQRALYAQLQHPSPPQPAYMRPYSSSDGPLVGISRMARGQDGWGNGMYDDNLDYRAR